MKRKLASEADVCRRQRLDFEKGVEEYLRESRQYDYHSQDLHKLLFVTPGIPCCCTRCHTMVSAHLLDQHWVIHEQGVDSVGAPGSTRWCPRPRTVVYMFGTLRVDNVRRVRDDKSPWD